jgi:hypothetical protein
MRDELGRCISLCKGNLIDADDLDGVDGICMDYGIDSGDRPEERIAFCKLVLKVMDEDVAVGVRTAACKVVGTYCTYKMCATSQFAAMVTGSLLAAAGDSTGSFWPSRR